MVGEHGFDTCKVHTYLNIMNMFLFNYSIQLIDLKHSPTTDLKSKSTYQYNQSLMVIQRSS